MSINWATNDYGARLIDFSSEIEGCEASNVLDSHLPHIWLSEEGVPQWLCISLGELEDKRNICIRTVGWHCSNPYTTNPKQVTIHVSADGAKFKVWDTFNSIHSNKGNYFNYFFYIIFLTNFIFTKHLGTHLFCCAPISISIYPFIALEVTETFGGTQTYMNRVYMYTDEIPASPLGIDQDQGEISNDEIEFDIIEANSIQFSYEEFEKVEEESKDHNSRSKDSEKFIEILGISNDDIVEMRENNKVSNYNYVNINPVNTINVPIDSNINFLSTGTNMKLNCDNINIHDERSVESTLVNKEKKHEIKSEISNLVANDKIINHLDNLEDKFSRVLTVLEKIVNVSEKSQSPIPIDLLKSKKDLRDSHNIFKKSEKNGKIPSIFDLIEKNENIYFSDSSTSSEDSCNNVLNSNRNFKYDRQNNKEEKVSLSMKSTNIKSSHDLILACEDRLADTVYKIGVIMENFIERLNSKTQITENFQNNQNPISTSNHSINNIHNDNEENINQTSIFHQAMNNIDIARIRSIYLGTKPSDDILLPLDLIHPSMKSEPKVNDQIHYSGNHFNENTDHTFNLESSVTNSTNINQISENFNLIPHLKPSILKESQDSFVSLPSNDEINLVKLVKELHEAIRKKIYKEAELNKLLLSKNK